MSAATLIVFGGIVWLFRSSKPDGLPYHGRGNPVERAADGRKETSMKKKETGAERILGRKLARELRGEELATASQPPDTITDGYVA
jgi:hypothetical protein